MCFDLNINGVSCSEFYVIFISFRFEIEIKKGKKIYQNSNVVHIYLDGCHSMRLRIFLLFIVPALDGAEQRCWCACGVFCILVNYYYYYEYEYYLRCVRASLSVSPV